MKSTRGMLNHIVPYYLEQFTTKSDQYNFTTQQEWIVTQRTHYAR